MRKIFYILFVFFIILSNSVSALTSSEYVTALEQHMFGSTYEKESLDKRIDRIEQQIYDNTYSGTPEKRLSKIDKIYPESEFELKHQINPKEQNYSNYNDEEYSEDYQDEAKYNNYPIVSEIEEKIYSHNYSGEDIYKRLERLEKELYGNVKNDMSLNERVNNLKSVLPKKNKNYFSSNDSGLNNYNFNSPTDYYDDNFQTADLINTLEKETFNKTFKGENNSRRLDRLESFYLGTKSIGLSDKERLNKISSLLLNTRENEYYPSSKGAQWAGILMNLLIIGLGFLL